ncbi:hypothetical protein QQP08_001271 [Theobroma cacao]|nr:hypothetical protein QQP08_001271 [Theobroma cacao]
MNVYQDTEAIVTGSRGVPGHDNSIAPATEQADSHPHPPPPQPLTGIPAMPTEAAQALAAFLTVMAGQAQTGQVPPIVPPATPLVPPRYRIEEGSYLVEFDEVPFHYSSDMDQASYFEEGLRNEIGERMIVAGREPHKEVVQMALRAEKLATENRRIRTEFSKRKNPGMSSNQPVKRGKDSVTSGSTTSIFVTSPQPSFPPSQQRPSRFSRSTMTGSGKSSRGFDRCRNCKNYHSGLCRGPTRCFQCGQTSHIRSNCPRLGRATVAASSPPARTDMQRRDSFGLSPRQGIAIRSGVESNTLAHPPSRPQTRTSTRVFAVTEDEAQVQPGAVTGIMSLFDKDAYVLIDSGLDRSYVSTKFASIADRNLSPLEGEIVVHTPLGEQLIRNTCYRDCGVRVGEEEFRGDLIPLEILDFDLILGERRVLPSCVILAIKASKLVQKGYSAYLAYVIDTSKGEPKLEDVPIVSEFPDVFPDDLSGLPLDRELEFPSDLLPSIALISIPPYRMGSAELKELKVQLQDLVDKGFIRLSISRWGAPILFVKKKDGTLRLCIDNR